MIRLFRFSILSLILIVLPVQAGPKKLMHSFGSNIKRTFYTDVRKHPFAWALPMALQWGTAFADTASSCHQMYPGGIETGFARHFVGQHPNCRKLVTLSVTAMFINSNSVNWLANNFKESCDREAAKPDSRWWKTPSHTKNTAACYWAVPWSAAGAQMAYEIPVIRSNLSW